jgi:hypothetical protein
MNSDKYVFSQIIDFVSHYEFEKCVKRYRSDHRIRDLNCWNQLRISAIQTSLMALGLASV